MPDQRIFIALCAGLLLYCLTGIAQSHDANCDALSVKEIHSADGKIAIALNIYINGKLMDSILTKTTGQYAHSEYKFLDLNLDGKCDLVVIDVGSATHGGMNHYYYMYHSDTKKYVPHHSLPSFNSGVEIDSSNTNRIVVHCPYRDCTAYYKYSKNAFTLVEGEFFIEP